jgi:hypothetical protein
MNADRVQQARGGVQQGPADPVRCPAQVGGEGLLDRQERLGATPEAVRDNHAHVLSAGDRGGHLGEPGLPDPRLTQQQHRVTGFATLDPRDVLAQQIDLQRPVDQRLR